MALKMTLVLSCFLLLSGCASHQLTVEANDVQVLKVAAPKECRQVGDVTGTGDSEEEAKKSLKVRAGEIGANFVQMDSITGNKCPGCIGGTHTVIHGLAYRCP